MNRRGDTSTNIVIFLTLIIVAGVLVAWYLQSIRPTRYIIGTVTEDMQEVQQHLVNACAADVYNATYLFSTKTGFYESNTTAFCIYTSVFGSCKPLPCSTIAPARFPLSENSMARIERNNAPIQIGPVSPGR